MAWTAPRTWVSGELVTASMGNTHWRDNQIALRAGEIAIASQAALDDIYASSSSQFARLAGGTKYQVRRLNNAGSAYERAAPRWLRAFDDTQAATGANTTETVLYTFAVNSNLLNVNGMTVNILAAGTTASNGNTKTIRVRWGGIGGTVGMTFVTSTSASPWVVEMRVSRISSNSQRVVGLVHYQAGATHANVPTTAAETESGVIDLVVTGQNGSANASDIVYTSAWVEQFGPPA